MADVAKQVREFIVENFLMGQEDVKFADGDSFMETRLIDSTGILEVIQFLEDTFEITVEDDEMIPENLDSVANIAAFVGRKTSGA